MCTQEQKNRRKKGEKQWIKISETKNDSLIKTLVNQTLKLGGGIREENDQPGNKKCSITT